MPKTKVDDEVHEEGDGDGDGDEDEAEEHYDYPDYDPYNDPYAEYDFEPSDYEFDEHQGYDWDEGYSRELEPHLGIDYDEYSNENASGNDEYSDVT
ncbi:hypothetical protein ABW20_dc0109130 [Dactylellina cionopaga]|nr:hypothetical protein ABW20_dc0109130 [Dactylellina cionopaga]